jgi:hypothetical protein
LLLAGLFELKIHAGDHRLLIERSLSQEPLVAGFILIETQDGVDASLS